MQKAATTLLSGPAAGPTAGILYATNLEFKDCLTMDMGGTSFDVALIKDLHPVTVTEGELDRYCLALPMLGIVSIGAGGGSIGWLDEGGLLRMGPQSATSDPGPACYMRGGSNPTCTDADLILGYLDADYFAGGRIKLDRNAAYKAIEEKIAKPMGMSVEEAAAGMYRVINTNMAFAVREATIKKGYDPREFPMVVAGGAGPLHACMIAKELELPILIVPRESSTFCAAGMLMTDIKHDFVKSFVSDLDAISPEILRSKVRAMIAEGANLLEQEKIPAESRNFELTMDLRYVKQYHEVGVCVSPSALGIQEIELTGAGKIFKWTGNLTSEGAFNKDLVLSDFHKEHNRLFGYSLEEDKTPVELINLRLRAIGKTEKPCFPRLETSCPDPSPAVKGKRKAFVPERGVFEEVQVYDALKLGKDATIVGPAILEHPFTTIFLSADFDMIVDSLGSYVLYMRDKKSQLPTTFKGEQHE
jgi:N-methylhydantoinase A